MDNSRAEASSRNWNFFGVANLLSLAILPGVLGHGIQAIADDDQKL